MCVGVFGDRTHASRPRRAGHAHLRQLELGWGQGGIQSHTQASINTMRYKGRESASGISNSPESMAFLVGQGPSADSASCQPPCGPGQCRLSLSWCSWTQSHRRLLLSPTDKVRARLAEPSSWCQQRTQMPEKRASLPCASDCHFECSLPWADRMQHCNTVVILNSQA